MGGFWEGLGRPKSMIFAIFSLFFRCKIVNAIAKRKKSKKTSKIHEKVAPDPCRSPGGSGLHLPGGAAFKSFYPSFGDLAAKTPASKLASVTADCHLAFLHVKPKFLAHCHMYLTVSLRKGLATVWQHCERVSQYYCDVARGSGRTITALHVVSAMD